MISSLLFLALNLAADTNSKWPDPYLGFNIRTFAAKYYAPQPGSTGDPYVKRYQKFLTLGLPFTLKNLSSGDVHGLHLIGVPEILFNSTSFIINAGLGLMQNVNFLNYRAFPVGWFWEADLCVHYGYLFDKKTYDRSEGAYVGKSIRMSDQTSLAVLGKLAIGPIFPLTKNTNLKIRIGMDWAYGMLGLFMIRSSLSDSIGSTWGVQAQLDFK